MSNPLDLNREDKAHYRATLRIARDILWQAAHTEPFRAEVATAINAVNAALAKLAACKPTG